MKKKTKLGMAVAAVVLMASVGVTAASAATPGKLPTRPLDTALNGSDAGYRFIVKYRAGSSELRDAAVVNRGLSSAASRAGLNRAVAASA